MENRLVIYICGKKWVIIFRMVEIGFIEKCVEFLNIGILKYDFICK